jgi:hypothetical protein
MEEKPRNPNYWKLDIKLLDFDNIPVDIELMLSTHPP